MSEVMTVTAPVLDIESLDLEARGVGRRPNETGEGAKVIFVEGALPGERVSYSSYRNKSNFEQARLVSVLRESASRTTPRCRFFERCGGCSMQHLDVRAQLAVKQRVLEDQLAHLAKTRAQQIFRPIAGPAWGYRSRARLAVCYVEQRGRVLVGFHERRRSCVADMTSCEILPPHISKMLVPLRALVGRLSIRKKMPQIEVAVGAEVTALVLRVLTSLTQADEALLREFAKNHQVQFWLQPKGPDSIFPLDPIQTELAYTLPEFEIRMPFKPTDFTQVNQSMNRVLISRAIRLLAPKRNERILDLFCGLGNFTLPLARLAAEVVGIEGSQKLTERAFENAQLNGVSERTSFLCRNLFEITADDLRALGTFDKWLIDPPRDGALAVVNALAECQAAHDPMPSRIVYVSCNPATLARDTAILVGQAGYTLRGAGIVNMFPHTSHIESIALFERDEC